MFKKIVIASFGVLSLGSSGMAQTKLPFFQINPELVLAEKCKVYVNKFNSYPYKKTTDLGPLGDSGFFLNGEYALQTDCKGVKGKIRAEAGVSVLGGINYALLSGTANVISERTTGKNHIDINLQGVGKNIYSKVKDADGGIDDTLNFPATTYKVATHKTTSLKIEGLQVNLAIDATADLDATIFYTLNNTKAHAFFGMVNNAGMKVSASNGNPGFDDRWYRVEGDLNILQNLFLASFLVEHKEGDTWNARGMVMDRVVEAMKGSLKAKGRYDSLTVDKTFNFGGYATWETPLEFNEDFTAL